MNNTSFKPNKDFLHKIAERKNVYHIIHVHLQDIKMKIYERNIISLDIYIFGTGPLQANLYYLSKYKVIHNKN